MLRRTIQCSAQTARFAAQSRTASGRRSSRNTFRTVNHAAMFCWRNNAETVSPLLFQQRRSYIFLPSTWSEIKHLLHQAWNTECKQERQAIFVKLLSRRARTNNNNNETSTHQPSTTASTRTRPPSDVSQAPQILSESQSIIAATHGNQGRRQKLRKRLRRGLIVQTGAATTRRNAATLGRRVMARRDSSPLYVYYTATKQALRRKLKRFSGYYDFRQQRLLRRNDSNATTTSADADSSSMSSSLRNYFHSRDGVRAKWKWVTRRIYLQEPFESTWFDPDGFPLTAQTPFGRYVNPWNSISTNGVQSIILFVRWRIERLWKYLGGGSGDNGADINRTESPTTTRTVPNNNCSTEVLPPLTSDSTVSTSSSLCKIRYTWIGHSTCLVHLDDKFTVLTDPHFSPRASPLQLWPFGVRRDVAPALSIHELPDKIDVCVISHDHYDHLDQESILRLKDRVQVFAVPCGIKEWLRQHCQVEASRIIEMAWWESASVMKRHGGFVVVRSGGTTEMDKHGDNFENEKSLLTLTCAPSQHWCGRTMFDRNQRLWCSWAVSTSAGTKFYFGGDTGLPPDFPLFRQIGDRLGPFDLAALPIGAYSPRYFMQPSHVHPSEAVLMHQQLRAKKSVAIHHATFRLADEALDEPTRLLDEAARHQGVDFCTLEHGGSLEVKKEMTLSSDTMTGEEVVENAAAMKTEESLNESWEERRREQADPTTDQRREEAYG